MTELTHLSLFSGIGGLDLAAEAAGFQTVGQCEWADYPTKVLEKHWPSVPRWRDIRNLTGDDFYARTGRWSATIISGGFPCQPFSVAGKRRGKEDDRYLWPEMCRVISEIRPAWVIGENVPGIINLALDTVLSDLDGQGYSCQTFIVPAAGVDAPHRRERICIVGWDHDRQSDGREPCDTVAGAQEGQNTITSRNSRVLADTTSKYAGGWSGESENKEFTSRESPQFLSYPSGGSREKKAGSNHKTFPYASVKGIGGISVQSGQARPSDAYAGGSCEAVSNSDDRRGALWRNGELPTASEAESGRSDNRGRTPEYVAGQWWPTEPSVGRVANGIPSRMDRLKCLGNAVVPQQFYPFFRFIAEIERSRP